MKLDIGFMHAGRTRLATSVIGLALASSSHGIEIEIDYSLDANGFFNQAGSKEALRAVCDYFESILSDDLSRIDASEWTGETWTGAVTNPATGGQTLFPGKVVPADTVIIYAGGRAMGGPLGIGGSAGYSASGGGPDGQAWFDLLKARGEAGALLTPRRDYGIWGGSVSFTTTATWNFSLTTGSGSASNFVSTALHELGHIFGVGTSGSWADYISGSVFTGPESVASFGRNVPLSGDGSHWQDDAACVFPTGFNPSNPLNVLSKTIGQFGTPAGLDQIARMDPSGCNVGGNLLVFTELDVAGLADIGWEIATSPPVEIVVPQLAISVNPLNSQVTLSWNADAGLSYQVTEAQSLAGWMDLGSPISGQSGLVNFIDPAPPVGRNFYRLEVDHAVLPSPPASPLASASDQWEGETRYVKVEPKMAEGCAGCMGHH
jgi:hypothetical protein